MELFQEVDTPDPGWPFVACQLMMHGTGDAGNFARTISPCYAAKAILGHH